MIDDTGPRITALERRVAALEREAVRFADLREAGEAKIEQARAARQDQTTGDGSKPHPRDSGNATTPVTTGVHGSSPCPPTSSPTLAEAIRPFMALGRPEGLLGAFHDLHEDAVLYENSGVAITVGDLRALQAAWLDLKGTP